MIDEEIKKQFGSWTAFSSHLGKNPKNFKRTFTGLIVKKKESHISQEIGISVQRLNR